jgi:hypothetical protein
MTEIELRLMGGLGNQLYQYAAARFFQEMYHCPRLVIDIGGYATYKVRNLELNSTLINKSVEFIRVNDLKTKMVREAYHCFQKMYNVVTSKHAPMYEFSIGYDSYVCTSVEFREPKQETRNALHLYGYFVSAEIAQRMRSKLMEEISLNFRPSEKYNDFHMAIRDNISAGVTIRCGDDYIKYGWPICSKEYYRSGMTRLMEEVDDCKFFIFSDNIEKIKKEKWFDGFDVTFVDGLNVCESFDLLRRCKHFVCSNSSFSWWGAFLSYEKDAIIFNPNKVFSGNSIEDDKRTFYSGMRFLDYIDGNPVNILTTK